MKTGLNLKRVTLEGGSRNGLTVSVPKKAERAVYADETYTRKHPPENHPQTGYPIFLYGAATIETADLPLNSLVAIVLDVEAEKNDQLACARALREIQPEGSDVSDELRSVIASLAPDDAEVPAFVDETAERFWRVVDGIIQAHGGVQPASPATVPQAQPETTTDAKPEADAESDDDGEKSDGAADAE